MHFVRCNPTFTVTRIGFLARSWFHLYLAQLINGILPLQLEVVRRINKAVEEGICLICNNGTVEDEEHFVFHYNFYFSERKEFYNYMKNNIPNFNNLSIEQKLRPPLLLTYVL